MRRMLKVLVACRKGDAERFVKAGFSLVNGTGEMSDGNKSLVYGYGNKKALHLTMTNGAHMNLLQRLAKQGLTFVAVVQTADEDDNDWIERWTGIVGHEGRFVTAPTNHRHEAVVEVAANGDISEDARQTASSFAYAWELAEAKLQ